MSRRTMLASPLALGPIRKGVDATDTPMVALPKGVLQADAQEAERLEALFDALRRTWPVEARARRKLARIEYKAPGWEEAFRSCSDLTHRRDRAHGHLAVAVLEVAGARDLTEDDWERFGLPWAMVATDRHLFVVHATDQSEFYRDNLRDGMTELVVLEL